MLRSARRTQVRLLWRELTSAALCVLAPSVVLLFGPWSSLVSWWPRAIATYGVGVIDGAFIMAMGWLINTRTHNLTMGVWAEGWTAELFGKQPGWRIVNNLPVDGYDIDHIVIAPAGVLAVETKYYGPTPIGRPDGHAERIERDLKTAKRRASRAAQLLSSESVGHRGTVTAVLILWGVGVPKELSVEQRGGVWLVAGSEPAGLFSQFGSARLDSTRAAQLEQALKELVREADRVAHGSRTRWWHSPQSRQDLLPDRAQPPSADEFERLQ